MVKWCLSIYLQLHHIGLLIFGGRIWPKLSSQARNNQIRKLQPASKESHDVKVDGSNGGPSLSRSLRMSNGAFSLTWPGSKQTYLSKIKDLLKKRVQLPQDLFGTPTWQPFYCFGSPIWPWRRHVKTLYRVIALARVVVKTLDSAILRINHNTADNYLGNPLGVVM